MNTQEIKDTAAFVKSTVEYAFGGGLSVAAGAIEEVARRMEEGATVTPEFLRELAATLRDEAKQ